MRSLIIFFISLIAFFLVMAVIGLLLPSKVRVTKYILIKASKEKVISQVEHFTNWQNWYPPMEDKSVTMVETDENNGLLKDSSGREISLRMNKSGSDSINVIFESISSSEIEYQFVFLPRNADSTQVTLNVNTTFKWYPWQKLKGIVIDKITGPIYEETLRNLKTVVEREKLD
ncbi:MAG: SRPBCC family protein [Ginsengibacter sp.]